MELAGSACPVWPEAPGKVAQHRRAGRATLPELRHGRTPTAVLV